MQKVAAFFLFAITISLAAPFEYILAQEASDEETTTDEEMMIEAEVMEEKQPLESPLKQMAIGTEPHEIQCMDGQKLVFKASNWRPACINESSYSILLERGWVSSHDPSHEDLAKMKEDFMASQPKEVEEPQDEIEIEEDVVLEGETDAGGNETESQNYTVELREDMEMGAQ